MDKDRTITIYDVAQEARVSMATVSRVVNNKTNVKEKTRIRVVEAIEKLNYQPNLVAKSLASKKTTTIGVVVPDISNIFFANLARGIEDVAEMYDYQVMLVSSDNDLVQEEKLVVGLLNKRVDGFVFVGHEVTPEIKEVLSKYEKPFILVGSEGDEEYKVNIDIISATRKAYDTLVSGGKKKVALVTNSINYKKNSERYIEGFQKATGAKSVEGQVLEVKYKYEDGYKLAERLIDSKFDAAFVTNDEAATGILNALTDRGIKVPEDFEVMTSNNTLLTEITRPSLTTLAYSVYDLGAISMRLLTKLLNAEDVMDSVIEIPFHIKKGTSTK
ncbi:MAG: LacI family transcriptional regulator [Lactobacillales bacterium]|jgi:LacI family transcriptional regulator|nr:LacI family transcriptional regulator [Lactobacillales bacterium]